MGLGNLVKQILIYKEPKPYERFELLEDEPIEQGQTTPPNTDGNSPDEASKPKGLLAKLMHETSKKSKDTVHAKLQTNLEKITTELNAPTNQDVVIREFKILDHHNAFIVYMDGMADNITINDYVLRQLMNPHTCEKEMNGNAIQYIVNNLLTNNQIKTETQYASIVKQLLNGLTALFVDGYDQCIMIETRGYEKRSVSEPLNESVVQGPHEGFIENLRTNITLVRRIIRNENLITEMLPAGKTSNVSCAILYMQGITNPKVINEVKSRINSLNIDFISAEGILNQLIEDHPLAILPQILSTERPDRAASLLIEGKVIIMFDGSPFASAVPVNFFHMLHTSEDYSLRWQYGTMQRLIRLTTLICALLLPGLYLALTLYHQEMIPSDLLITLAKARENLPFPVILEVLIMELAWEIIREAGIRVPGVVGQTLGIVGGVILGQAAVAAGLVSPISIIIIAITGLSSFAIPNFSLQYGIRLSRFFFTFCGAIAGFYGIAACTFIFGGFACSMKSFGVPFFTPVAPKTKSYRDLVIRWPAWQQTERPDAINTLDRTRSKGQVRGWANRQKKRKPE